MKELIDLVRHLQTECNKYKDLDLNNNSLKLPKIDLCGCDINENTLKLISKALEANAPVEEINLSNTKISIDKIIGSLAKNNVLKKINLSNNSISREGGKNLKEVLIKNTTLQEIYLSNNDIGSDINGIAYIAQGLEQNNKLTRIDLSYNRIDIVGAKRLIGVLDTNKIITNLDISEPITVGLNKIDYAKLRRELQEKIDNNKSKKLNIEKLSDNVNAIILEKKVDTKEEILSDSTETCTSQEQILQSIIMDQTQPITIASTSSTPKSSKPSQKSQSLSNSPNNSPHGSKIGTVKKQPSETEEDKQRYFFMSLKTQNEHHTEEMNKLKAQIEYLEKLRELERIQAEQKMQDFEKKIYKQMQVFQDIQAKKISEKIDKKKQQEYDKKLAAFEELQQNLTEQLENKKLEVFEKFEQNLAEQLENNNFEITNKMKNDMQEIRGKMKNLAEKEDVERLDKLMTNLQGTTQEALEGSISSMKKEVTNMINERVEAVINDTNKNILTIQNQIISIKDITPEEKWRAEKLVDELNYDLSKVNPEMNISIKKFKKYNEDLMVGDEINIKLLHLTALKEYLVKSVVTDAKKEIDDF